MSTTTTVSRATHGSLRPHVSSQRECLGECFNAPLQARKVAAPIAADALVPLGPMQPVQHVVSPTSKGTVTTVFPHSRTLKFPLVFPMDFVVSHDDQVAFEESKRKATCASVRPLCTERTVVVGTTAFPTLARGEGNASSFAPRATTYSKEAMTPEERMVLANRHGSMVPVEHSLCGMLGTLPQVGEEHPEVRDLALLPIEERTDLPPVFLRFVPEDAPRGWIRAARRKVD